MSIKMYKIGHRNVPKLCCDECGEPITDTLGALALWLPSPDESTPATVFVVHKGNCDRSKSRQLLAERGSLEQREMTDELSQHVVKLLLNTNMVSVKSMKGDQVKYDTSVLDQAFKMNELSAMM